MAFQVIANPSFQPVYGFTQAQFKKLDDLYCRGASARTLMHRTVECDFESGYVSYTYYKAQDEAPFAQFIIRRAGPKTVMYEIFLQDKGRIAKSSLFDRAFDALREVLMSL